MRIVCNPNSKDIIFRFVAILLALILLTACGEGQDDEDSYDPGGLADDTTNYADIYRRAFSQEEIGGLTTPKVQAKRDNDGNVHFVFYTRGVDLFDRIAADSNATDTNITLPDESILNANDERYNINHLVYNPGSDRVVRQEILESVSTPYAPSAGSEPYPGDQGIDNSMILAIDISADGHPMVVYEGGSRSQYVGGENCNPRYQGDLMLSIRSGGGWDEYLGIQGDASVRNAAFPDGLMAQVGDVAIDRDGNVHMIAQHYYEWCDLTAINSPDLLYVQKTPATLSAYDTAWEETVGVGNVYTGGGGILNATGYHCRLILDGTDETQPEIPMAFYFGINNGRYSLIAARRVGGEIGNGDWDEEVIRNITTDFIIDYISPAISEDGTIGVAYYMHRINPEEGELGDHLCYAERQVDEEGNVSWSNIEVDYQSYCGNYCSLAFDSENQPAIAYHDRRAYTPYREREDVKLAYWDGRDWRKEVIAKHGDIGDYNTLWFSGTTPYIVSYEHDEVEDYSTGIITQLQSIVLFRRDRPLERLYIAEEE